MSRGTVVSPVPNASLGRRLAAGLKRTPSGCLEWAGYRDPTSRYGKIADRPGSPIGVLVAAWVLRHGAVPSGLVVRHSCDNPPRAAGEHLRLGTQADNVADMVCRLLRARRAARIKRAEAGKIQRWATCAGCEYAPFRCRCAPLRLGAYLPRLESS